MLVQTSPRWAVTAGIILSSVMGPTPIVPWQNQDWWIQLQVTAMNFSRIPLMLLLCIWLSEEMASYSFECLRLDSSWDRKEICSWLLQTHVGLILSNSWCPNSSSSSVWGHLWGICPGLQPQAQQTGARKSCLNPKTLWGAALHRLWGLEAHSAAPGRGWSGSLLLPRESSSWSPRVLWGARTGQGEMVPHLISSQQTQIILNIKLIFKKGTL